MYKIEYLCGLLSLENIELIKKNRRFEHLLGSYAKKEQMFNSFIRPVN